MKKLFVSRISLLSLLLTTIPLVALPSTLIDEDFQSPIYSNGTSTPAFAGWTMVGTPKSRTSAAQSDIPCDDHPTFNNQLIQFEYATHYIRNNVAHNWSTDDVFVLSVKASPQNWNPLEDRYIIPSLRQQDGTVLWTSTDLMPHYNNFGRNPWTAAQQFQWTIPASAFTAGTPGQLIRLQLESGGYRGTYIDDVKLTVSNGVPPTTYTVTYDGNGNTGGAAPSSQTKDVGVDLTLATNSGTLVKTGSTFSGWNTAADGNGTDYAAGATYSADADLTLFAHWRTNQYAITFDSVGGTAVADITLDYGATVTAPADPTKDGYTFTGWTPAVPTTMPASNTTCVAQWTVANNTPVADDTSVTADKNIAVDVTLTGSDADLDDLTYTVVSDPSNGILSGTVPALTYTPNFHFSGTDSFTFKVNDGTVDSNIATVSITVKGVQVLNYTAPTPGTVKTYKVALIMLNTLTTQAADNSVTPRLEFYSPEKLGQIFFEHEHGAAAFINEASYGKVAIEGTVVGWVDDPTAGLNSSAILANMDDYFSLFDDYLTHSDYDLFVFHGLVEGGGQQTGWVYPQQSFTSATQGNISGIGITWMINSGVFDFAPLNVSNWSSGDSVLPTTSWSHEMLHSFGISGHANSYNCGTETLAVDGTSSPIKAYGDSFSIMGESAYATHPNALMKSRIGWLTPAQLPEITSNGTYDIYPMVAADDQTKALVIPLDPLLTHTQHGAGFDALIVEYRTATGFDRYLERLDGSTFLSWYTSLTDIDRNGVLVYLRYADTGTDSTLLLDMNPTTAYNPNASIKLLGNAGKFADAILPVGGSFTWESIQITPLGTNALGGMQVSVTVGPSPYSTWSGSTFTNAFTDKALTSDPDGDGWSNLKEFALGTDPTSGHHGSLATNGSANGTPRPVSSDGGDTVDLYFVRRDDHGTSGSLTYTPQFSSDLGNFTDSTAIPTFVADSAQNPDYEIVKVPYTAGQSFGRVKIDEVP